MKRIFIIFSVSFFCLFFCFFGGCQEQQRSLVSQEVGDYGSIEEIYGSYGVRRIHLLGLTEIMSLSSRPGVSKLTVYVDLLDSYDSRVKSPGTFRFELYRRIPRSSEPKGRRIAAWNNLDLINPKVNSEHWREYLRAYKFEFEVDIEADEGLQFIVEVTFINPEGKRFSDSMEVDYGD